MLKASLAKLMSLTTYKSLYFIIYSLNLRNSTFYDKI